MILSRELPVVDESICTGCGDCVTICPTDCLAMGRQVVWLPRPADCIACAACVWICPANAITLETGDEVD